MALLKWNYVNLGAVGALWYAAREIFLVHVNSLQCLLVWLWKYLETRRRVRRTLVPP